MSSSNFLCIICSENISYNNEIVSTQCGHVFHVACLKKHHNKTPQCPQCLAEITNTTVLHLKFEIVGTSKEHQITELRSEIDHLYRTRCSLNNELETCKKELLNLRGELNGKIQELTEKNKKIDLLALQIRECANDVMKKTIEIHKLKENLKNGNPQRLSLAFEEEIKVLKEKNEQFALELNKEIRNSSQLTTEKIRLETMLEQFKRKTNLNTLNDKNNGGPDNERKEKTENTKDDTHEQVNEDVVRSVVIKNIKERFEDDQSIKKYVYKLSDLMDLFFTGDDVENVKVMNPWQGSKMAVIVKFKTLSMKSMFLSRKDKLKLNDGMKHLFLYEYVADKTYILFQQAKSLRSSGFEHVYCRNNVVLVKKDKQSAPITIECTQDIQKLKVGNEN